MTFKTALTFEILANLSSLPTLFARPEYALSFLTTGPSQITPATRTLAQWFGGLVAALTVPLILSLPTPAAGPAGEAQRGTRRIAYITLGAGEVAMAGLMVWSYTTGADSGMTDTALLGAATTLTAFLGMRGFFLYWKPELMEERGTKKTA